MVNFNNFSNFIKNLNPKIEDCAHLFPSEFQKIGTLTDESIIPISYLDFCTKDKNEIFIGSYPYNASIIWKCNKCNSITLSYTNDSGWGQLVKLPIDFSKEYLIEPANKSIHIEKTKLEKFIKHFELEFNPDEIKKNTKIGTKIVKKDKISIFSFDEYVKADIEFVKFEIVGQRNLLRRMSIYIKDN